MGENVEVKEKPGTVTSIDLSKLLNETVDGKLAGIARMSDVEAKVKEMADSLKLKEEAVMEERALAGFTKSEFFGIPLGQIAIGTFGGVFLSEITDGFLATQSTMVKGLVKLGAAGLVGTWGRRWMSKEVAMPIVLVLGVFGLSQVLPVDKWAAQLAGSIKGILPGTIKVTGMPGDVVNQKVTGMPGNVVNQAESVLERYGGIARRVG